MSSKSSSKKSGSNMSTTTTPATEKKMKKMGASSSSSKKAQSISPSQSNTSLSYILTDRTVTKAILTNLNLLLSNATTKQLFFEFSEKELSSNHLMFYFDAKEFRDTYIEPANGASESPESQEQQREVSIPNSQQSDVGMVIPINENSSGSVGNNSNNGTPKSGRTPVTQRKSVKQPLNEQESSQSNNIISISGDVTVARADSFNGADINSSLSSIVEKVTRESGEAGDDDQLQKNYLIASGIFEKYLSPSSPIEVNLDYRTFIEISKRIQNRQIHQKIYDRAIKEIYDVINNDSYHRFKSTPLFKSLVLQAEALENLPPLSPSSTSSSSSEQQDQSKEKPKKKLFSCFG